MKRSEIAVSWSSEMWGKLSGSMGVSDGTVDGDWSDEDGGGMVGCMKVLLLRRAAAMHKRFEPYFALCSCLDMSE